ncbi:MAG: DUF4347 domain-containing protein, partial [Nitrospira sp.]
MPQKNNQKQQSAPKAAKKPSLATKSAGAARTKAPSPVRSKLSLLSLESRLMFDAAAAATAADVNQEQVAQEQAEAAVSGDSNEETQGATDSQELLQAFTTYLPIESRQEIVFVDPTVPNYQDLLSGMDPHIEVIMLDGGQDGIEQMASVLSGRTGIDAIHVISHGSAGALQLGTGILTTESMTSQYADELATIRQTLSEQADILVYGCDFAEGEAGQTAASQLAALTGADVAASTDLTGSAVLGGDWVLEAQTGTIESQVVVTEQAQAAYGGVLDITTGLVGQWTFDTNANDLSGNGNHGTLSGNATIDTNTATNIVGGGKLSLDGVDDYVNLTARLSSFSSLSQGTIATWVKFTGTGMQTIYNIGDGASNQNWVFFYVENGNLRAEVEVNNSPQLRVVSNATINDGNWHHVAFTVNSSGNALYIDGQVAARSYEVGSSSTTTFISSINNEATAEIGAFNDGAINGELNGQLDDVRIYNRALSATDIGQLYVTGNDPPVNTVPGAQSTNEDTNRVFSTGNGNQISISDLDAGSSAVEVTVSVTNGALTLSGTSGLTFTTGDGTSDTTMTFRGTVTNINTALNGLIYSPTSNYSGGATLTITSRDNTLVSLDVNANLQARYTFEGNANDVASGTAQNGTLINGATYVTDGTRGQVLSLDGVNDYVQITGTFSNPSEITIGGWVNLSSGSGRKEFISLSDRVHIALDDALGVKGSIQIGASSWIDLNSNQFIAGAGWHHVMYSYSDSTNTHSLYIDGVRVATATVTSSIYWTGATDTFIGSHPTAGNYAAAMIDDVRIYNRVLTAAEVSSLANDLTLTDTDTVSITVTAVNDAPVLTDTALTLTVAEDAGPPANGTAVGSLISAFTGGVSDVDASAVKGIAITGTNQTNGTWYYTTNGGTTWTAVGTVSNTSALLLADNANTRLYFAPNANYNGTSAAALTLRAWDQTSGTAGTKVSTASNGGTTAFSSATDTIDVTVSAVNDGPVFTSLNGTPAYTENGSAVVLDNNVTITDTELTAANNFNGATLTLTRNGGANSQDVFSATGTLSSITAASGNVVVGGTTIGTYTNSGGTLVMTFNSSATNTLVNSAMQQIAYSNSSDAPPSSVQVNWTFSDNNSGSQGSGGALTATGSVTVSITAVNDAPVLTDTALTLTV